MDRAELDRIEAACRIIEPRDGSQIFAAGAEADAVYAVVGGAGRVRIGALDRNDKGLMIEVFGTGDIFGDIGVIDGSTRTADAVAECRVRLLRISSRVFLDALHSNPMLGVNLCGIFAGRLRRTAMFRDATFEAWRCGSPGRCCTWPRTVVAGRKPGCSSLAGSGRATWPTCSVPRPAASSPS
jgi:CRP-like cAMP-binding protein